MVQTPSYAVLWLREKQKLTGKAHSAKTCTVGARLFMCGRSQATDMRWVARLRRRVHSVRNGLIGLAACVLFFSELWHLLRTDRAGGKSVGYLSRWRARKWDWHMDGTTSPPAPWRYLRICCLVFSTRESAHKPPLRLRRRPSTASSVRSKSCKSTGYDPRPKCTA